MPLVTDYAAVKEIYAEAAKRGIGLPVFCAEDRETLEDLLIIVERSGDQVLAWENREEYYSLWVRKSSPQ